MAIYDGITCDNNVQVRRIIMYDYSPGSLDRRDLYILPYDDAASMTPTDLEAYEADDSNYSIVPFRPKKNPKNHWAVPFVTGHKYYVRWAFGLDFEKMNFMITSWLWDETDGDIEFVMPHYDTREAVYVDTNHNDRIGNYTLFQK